MLQFVCCAVRGNYESDLIHTDSLYRRVKLCHRFAPVAEHSDSIASSVQSIKALEMLSLTDNAIIILFLKRSFPERQKFTQTVLINTGPSRREVIL